MTGDDSASAAAANTAPPPRRLRLSAILLDLAEDAEPAADGSDPSRPRRSPRSNVTVGEILERTTHSGYGFLIAFLALASIPFPGVSFPFGLAIGFGGAQMLAGRDRPWLPKRILNHAISMRSIAWLGQRVVKWTRGLEKLVKPRLMALAHRPFLSLLGAGLVIQGVGLALPIPIPGSNWIFIVPILIYAVGLLEGDGVLLLLGHALTSGEIVLGALYWRGIVAALERAFAWIGSLL